MGGAVGHLQHLHDDRSLTFSDIKAILTAAAEGNLKFTEKLDGLNVVFSWDIKSNVLKIARSMGDIKRFGLDSVKLSEKFSGRDKSLQDAFNLGYAVLKGSLDALSLSDKIRIFGKNANMWYSAEIIYTASPNVIHYSQNAVVLHAWPTFAVNKQKISFVANSKGVFLLASRLKEMQKSVAVKNWSIFGPTTATLGKLKDSSALKKAINSLDVLSKESGLDEFSSIDQYIRNCLSVQIKKLRLTEDIQNLILARCMEDECCLTLTDIRKKADKKHHAAITEFVKTSSVTIRTLVRPIELIVNDFSIELLRDYRSPFIVDSAKEVKRIKEELSGAIEAIRRSNSARNLEILSAQMEKLKSVENISTAAEGTVFLWKGNAYKFTGNFSAINQLLGLFKYGN